MPEQDDMAQPEHPVIPKELRQHIIKAEPDMAKYKMVYNQRPGSRALLLRFPNRGPDKPYCSRLNQKPLELRIKPKNGFVEVDIPINIHDHWDLGKAIEYQQAMRKSTVLQHGQSYGLAGGLGAGVKPAPANANGSSEEVRIARPAIETLLANPDDANNKGHIMNKITLGGRIFAPDDTQPRYLMGTFKGDVCYMSHVDAIVELTANFTHLDALSDLTKSAARHQRYAEREKEEPEAKAVNITVKSSEPDEDEMPGGRSRIAQLLKEMAEEPWQRLKWVDQDDPKSYEKFDEHFGIDKGVGALPELVSTVTPEQWLDMMSAPRYDYTTKSYREMTFPRKGKRDPRLNGYINGTTGYVDREGWEWVDPNEPRDPNFTYEEVSEFSAEEDVEDDENEDDYDGSAQVTDEEIEEAAQDTQHD
ncbi:MAG: hypothetical protein Q9222_000972 [Ikaeria aurantiellina]